MSWNGKESNRSVRKFEEKLISVEEIIKTEDDEIEALTATTTKKGNQKKIVKKGTEKNEQKKFNGKCFHYERIGHKKENYWKLTGTKAKSKPIDKKKNKGQSDKDNAEADDGLFFARASIAEANATMARDVWLADSGASYHMSFNKSLFDKLEESQHKRILLGDNRTLEVVGKGEVKILDLQNEEWKPWRLTNVLYIPELCNNLFSYSACTSHGYEIISTQNGIKIIKNDIVKASGVRFKNLYKMHFKTCKDPEANSVQDEETMKLEKLQIWHERLGHASLTIMEKMINYNSSIGLKKEDLQKFSCEACILAKAHRKTFKKSSEKNYDVGEFAFRRLWTISNNGVQWSKIFCSV